MQNLMIQYVYGIVRLSPQSKEKTVNDNIFNTKKKKKKKKKKKRFL